MIEHNAGTTTITCDKCGQKQSAPSDCYNDIFSEDQWGLFPNARKYIHKCFHCLPKRYKQLSSFAALLRKDPNRPA